MVEFGYNNNAIRNQKHFKPMANGNVANSGMIALTISFYLYKHFNEYYANQLDIFVTT